MTAALGSYFLRGVSLVLSVLTWNCVTTARADIINVDVSGWETYDDIGADARNTSRTLNIGAASQVTEVRWIGLTFESVGNSFRSELVFGLSRPDAVDQTGFWDFNPAAGINSPGIYGPLNGSFGPGLVGSGPFRVANDGVLQVDIYSLFNRNAGTTGTDGREARVSAGQLQITYITAVPEPSTIMLIGLVGGTGGIYALRSRRRSLRRSAEC